MFTYKKSQKLLADRMFPKVLSFRKIGEGPETEEDDSNPQGRSCRIVSKAFTGDQDP